MSKRRRRRNQKTPKTESFNISTAKEPRSSESPDAYYDMRPRWLFSQCDFGLDKWSITNCEDLQKDFFGKLASFESMTWKEIFSAAGARRKGNNNHPIPVDELVIEAQERLRILKLNPDELISLRVGGPKRIYGIRYGSDLQILWYTDNHDIVLSTKRHT